MGPMVYIKTYTFNHFYEKYLVLLTMVPRISELLANILAGSVSRFLPPADSYCR